MLHGRHVGPNLHCSTCTGGVAGRPTQGRLEVGNVNDKESTELFLGRRKWTILNCTLSVLIADRRRAGGRFEASATHDDPRLEERSCIREKRSLECLFLARIGARVELLGLEIEHQRVLHELFLIRGPIASDRQVSRAARRAAPPPRERRSNRPRSL